MLSELTDILADLFLLYGPTKEVIRLSQAIDELINKEMEVK